MKNVNMLLRMMISLLMMFSLNLQAIANDNNPETEEIASAVTAALLESYEQAVAEKEWQNELLEALRNGESTVVGTIAELPDGTACVIPPDEVVTPRFMGDKIEVVSELNSELECTNAQLGSIHYAQIKEEITYASLGGTEVAAVVPIAMILKPILMSLGASAIVGCIVGIKGIKAEVSTTSHQSSFVLSAELPAKKIALIGLAGGLLAGSAAKKISLAIIAGAFNAPVSVGAASITTIVCGGITYLISS